MKVPVRIIGVPKCQYCERYIDIDESGWGMASDLITGLMYYYHLECFVIQPDYEGGLYGE
jgi:hypothetical protein